MIGMIFATLQEARPFLLASQAASVRADPFAVYRTVLNPTLRVVVSGIGKVAAATACQSLILTHGVTRIINAGACGALRESPERTIGDLVWISEAIEGDHEVFGKRLPPCACLPLEHLELPAARLVTNDRPVFDTHRRTAFAKLGDVVDMEGAAIARAAAYHSIPCTLIKGITDNAQPMDRKTLLGNLGAVSEQIAQRIWQALINTCPVPGS